jgi:hypothetical protein
LLVADTGDHLPWQIRFKRRAIHALIVLSSLAYLQMMIRFFQGINCTAVNNQLLLMADYTTECYAGGHLATAFFLWPGLFGFGIVYPAWTVWKLYVRIESQADPVKTEEIYGYLYRGKQWVVG